ncbi:phage holin family protein [Paenibacillus jiagnxiensis]|uniref:phage holin family protein n=1 Tax=Paenibacillus jiagnxiensis TaxID=3228926 RepID=UPI0038D45E78
MLSRSGSFFVGWTAAWINGELKNRSGYYGFFRKITVSLLISIAHLIDGILGNEHYFRDAVVFFYLANELLSIIENVGRMGVPMRDILLNAVAIFQSRSNVNKIPIGAKISPLLKKRSSSCKIGLSTGHRPL